MHVPRSKKIPDRKENTKGEEMRNRDWRKEAACRNAEIHVFYQGRGNKPKAYDVARSYCDRCPVLADCFEFIMEVESNPENGRHGMFAGMTPMQRQEYQEARDRYVPTP
jgi:hypothetical protein